MGSHGDRFIIFRFIGIGLLVGTHRPLALGIARNLPPEGYGGAIEFRLIGQRYLHFLPDERVGGFGLQLYPRLYDLDRNLLRLSDGHLAAVNLTLNHDPDGSCPRFSECRRVARLGPAFRFIRRALRIAEHGIGIALPDVGVGTARRLVT